MQEFEPTQAQEYRELIPVLDEAIERLGPRDRSGVVMCYFQQRSYRQIGATLGITEEAARKRVARAVGRMRDYFAVRGVVSDRRRGRIVSGVRSPPSPRRRRSSAQPPASPPSHRPRARPRLPPPS